MDKPILKIGDKEYEVAGYAAPEEGDNYISASGLFMTASHNWSYDTGPNTRLILKEIHKPEIGAWYHFFDDEAHRGDLNSGLIRQLESILHGKRTRYKPQNSMVYDFIEPVNPPTLLEEL